MIALTMKNNFFKFYHVVCRRVVIKLLHFPFSTTTTQSLPRGLPPWKIFAIIFYSIYGLYNNNNLTKYESFIRNRLFTNWINKNDMAAGILPEQNLVITTLMIWLCNDCLVCWNFFFLRYVPTYFYTCN